MHESSAKRMSMITLAKLMSWYSNNTQCSKEELSKRLKELRHLDKDYQREQVPDVEPIFSFLSETNIPDLSHSETFKRL